MDFNLIRVVAQLVNFLLLVWLLRRFLFEPITSIMKAREDRIREGLERGQTMQEEADAAKRQYDKKLADFEAERQQAMQEVRDQVEAARGELLEEARSEAETARNRYRSALEREQQETRERLHRETVSHACTVAGQILERLTGVSLEERAAEIMLERLDSVDSKELEPFRKALQSRSRVAVQSQSELPGKTRERLAGAINELAGGREVDVEFSVDSDVICGLRISAAGAIVDWNAASHLSRVESISRHALSGKSEVTGDAGSD